MDKAQFALAIVANIVTIIIIWAWNRLIRGAKTLLTTGTITAKVRQIFTAKRITILGSLLAVVFNLWILGRIVLRGRSFDRWELLSAILVSLLIAYWLRQLLNAAGFGIAQRLHQTESRIAFLEASGVDRRVTANQKAKIAASLSSTPKGEVFITSGLHDRESSAFAHDLRASLTEVGWYVPIAYYEPSGRQVEGLFLLTKDPSNPTANALYDALIGANIPVIPAVKENFTGRLTVQLLVASKPHPESLFSD